MQTFEMCGIYIFVNHPTQCIVKRGSTSKLQYPDDFTCNNNSSSKAKTHSCFCMFIVCMKYMAAYAYQYFSEMPHDWVTQLFEVFTFVGKYTST